MTRLHPESEDAIDASWKKFFDCLLQENGKKIKNDEGNILLNKLNDLLDPLRNDTDFLKVRLLPYLFPFRGLIKKLSTNVLGHCY